MRKNSIVTAALSSDPSLVTLNEHEASAVVGLAVKTLQRRRWEGLPPVFLKLRLFSHTFYMQFCHDKHVSSLHGDRT